jgi:hypothetical protein
MGAVVGEPVPAVFPRPVTADTGPRTLFNGMDAAFMSFQPRESGIHALRSVADEASVTKARFRCTPGLTARRVRTTINLS